MKNNIIFTFPERGERKPNTEKRHAGVPVSAFIATVCIVLVVSILLTWSVTVSRQDVQYRSQILESNNTIKSLYESIEDLKTQLAEAQADINALDVIEAIVENRGYYADRTTEQERVTAALKAYVASLGDNYAEYYTDEEYAKIQEDNEGNYSGIGVNVVQAKYEYDLTEYSVFQVFNINEGSPASGTDMQIGDRIYAILVEEEYRTIDDLGGYTFALSAIRGEAGTDVTIKAFREVKTEDGIQVVTKEFTMTRADFVTQSVISSVLEDGKTAHIRITTFNMQTPHQVRDAILKMQNDGVEHFVLDLRNNPGGLLVSIQATLCYFLQENDLILSAEDKNGEKLFSTYAQVIDEVFYPELSVSQSEVGMFADLDFVVLANSNTASAAEVFVATVQDYELAPFVGTTTFGKGIIQSVLYLSSYDEDLSGVVKLTTSAYTTKRGVTYHDIGITPDVEVRMSEEYQNISLYLLEPEQDAQLQKALELFK